MYKNVDLKYKYIVNSFIVGVLNANGVDVNSVCDDVYFNDDYIIIARLKNNYEFYSYDDVNVNDLEGFIKMYDEIDDNKKVKVIYINIYNFQMKEYEYENKTQLKDYYDKKMDEIEKLKENVNNIDKNVIDRLYDLILQKKKIEDEIDNIKQNIDYSYKDDRIVISKVAESVRKELDKKKLEEELKSIGKSIDEYYVEKKVNGYVKIAIND
jgi:hypothetical protein